MPDNLIHPLKWTPLKPKPKRGRGEPSTLSSAVGVGTYKNTDFFLLVRQKGQLFLLPTKTISHATLCRPEKGSFDSFPVSKIYFPEV